MTSARRFSAVGVVWISLSTLWSCQRVEAPAAQTRAVAAEQVFRWKLITTWPKNLPGLGTAPERLADDLRLMSDGRLNIKVYGARELVGAFEVFDAVSQGTAQMGHGAAYYWRGKIPVAAMFATVPFGMTAQEMNGWLRYGGGRELWAELYEPFGLIPFAAGNSGVQMAGWFNKEINSLADLQGLKMRIPGLGGAVLKRAGGVPVTLPGSVSNRLRSVTRAGATARVLASALFDTSAQFPTSSRARSAKKSNVSSGSRVATNLCAVPPSAGRGTFAIGVAREKLEASIDVCA